MSVREKTPYTRERVPNTTPRMHVRVNPAARELAIKVPAVRELVAARAVSKLCPQAGSGRFGAVADLCPISAVQAGLLASSCAGSAVAA
ncbi:hypothetical protein [Kitasatospora phosalacinea]|uniref:hypothetical protein n=1 Tax=Kitasatospora phosalacinea TaxID=2065 RepID=UPI002552D096|nr:hypothetical protein [Kitasatospora phosalacinea]